MIGADLNFSEEFVNSIFEKIKCIKKCHGEYAMTFLKV